MPPSLALLLWLILLVALLRFDPAKTPKTSIALWVPVIWMFILGSRLPSQWLGGQVGQAAAALEEGNPIDRIVSSALILLAIGILISRSFKWGDFLVRNLALTAFLAFALLSGLWSDFPLIAFKRWFRDLGNYLVILIALSDPRPLEAIRTLLRRLCYLLIPLSILLIKYFPEIAKHYSVWTGAAEFVGPTTSKNMLGAVCLISGLFFFWDSATRWLNRKERRTKHILLVNVTLFAMTLWVLTISNSATSRLCLLLGCLVIAAAHSKLFQRRRGVLKVIIPACFCLYVILAFGFNLNARVAETIGRDPTLTDRTRIWKLLLAMHTNPLFGTGYESFWLGPRLQWFWQTDLGQINEAHNGYLEIYLNLGIVGLFLLIGFLIASYQTICRTLGQSISAASLPLALWTVLLFYNVSEAGFRSGVLWLTFLMGALAVYRRPTHPLQSVAAGDNPYVRERVSSLPLQIESQWR
jgi:exopolysaccharide production protein ExoQ